MKGGSAKESRGFTIVETLIVLAVTGLTLVAALTLIGGRQSRTQFTVGIGQVQQQVQQVISEVKNGYYPAKNDILCQADTTSGPILTIGSSGQGQNGSCIFLGKAIQFGTDNSSGEMVLIPIAANRLNLTGKEVTSLGEALPRAVAPMASNTVPDAKENRFFSNGIRVVDMWKNGNRSTEQTGAIAVLFDFASYNALGSLNPGALQTSLYSVNTTEANINTDLIISAINNHTIDVSGPTPVAHLEQIARADVCFASSTTNQSGLLTIGGSTTSDSRELSVRMEIMDGTTTC